MPGCRSLPTSPTLKTKNDWKDHSTDIFYFSKSVAPCLRYLVVAMIPNNQNCKPRTSMDSLRLLHGPLRSIFSVTHKLSDIREPGKVLQAGSWWSWDTLDSWEPLILVFSMDVTGVLWTQFIGDVPEGSSMYTEILGYGSLSKGRTGCGSTGEPGCLTVWL